MTKDTLFPWSDNTVLRIQRNGPSHTYAFVHLMQPEQESNFGEPYPARSISATMDAQKARDVATMFLMLAEQLEASK